MENTLIQEVQLSIPENRSRTDYVQRWGHADSIALLDPACKIFTIPSIDGLIGYRLELACAVVLGDPLCAPDDVPQLTYAFHEYCKKNKLSIIYAAATQRFAQWALQHRCQSAMAIGDEIILDPYEDPRARTGADASSLRNKCNHSVRQGVTVKEYTGNDQHIEQALQQLAEAWVQQRRGPQIYIAPINLFAHRNNKRWFYAEQNGRFIGALILNRIDAYQGWVLNLLMVVPPAPNTTSEFLVLSALDILRAEGCHYLSVGTMPAPELRDIVGFGKVSTWVARKVFKIAQKIFKLGERQRYWKKFKPQMKPSYVLFSTDRIKLREVIGIMRAFNAMK